MAKRKYTLCATINNVNNGENYNGGIIGNREKLLVWIDKAIKHNDNATSFVFTVARVAKSTGGDQSGGGSEQEG